MVLPFVPDFSNHLARIQFVATTVPEQGRGGHAQERPAHACAMERRGQPQHQHQIDVTRGKHALSSRGRLSFTNTGH
jgi:hypothetical protein